MKSGTKLLLLILALASGLNGAAQQKRPLQKSQRMTVKKLKADSPVTKMPVVKPDTAGQEAMPVVKPPANVQPK